MSGPCNNINLSTIKVSKLVKYSNLDLNDFFLTIESGSSLYSRRSTFGDLLHFVHINTGSFTGSFSGSFIGKFDGEASGSFSGSYFGSIVSKNAKITGSFNGTNSKISGSFSGSHWGSLVSKNTKATGSFSGSHWGSLTSKNTKATGSFSGSHWGSLTSKNAKATGSFRGVNSNISGSFSGSVFGRVVSKNGIITGSFKGIDNITNFNGTGKKVSFNGTASYAITSSYSEFGDRIPIFAASNNSPLNIITPTTYTISFTLPTGYSKWDEFYLQCIAHVDEDNSNNDGSISATLTYGGATPFINSSTEGCGNSGRSYYINNDDDVTTATWTQIGIVRSSLKTTSTLTMQVTVTPANVIIKSVDLIGKVYAKK